MPQRIRDAARTAFLYLHGFASGPGSKKAQFFRRRLQALGIDLAVPDLAEGDFEDLTITGQLEVVRRVLAGRKAVLIGSSLGGYLAALYAARNPEVARLVLLAPAFAFARRWESLLGPEELGRWKETGVLPVFHHGEERLREVRYGLLEDARRYEDFPEVAQPALVFHGTADTVVPSALSEEFAAPRGNVRLRLVDSDHELQTALDTIWRESSEFLAGEPC